MAAVQAWSSRFGFLMASIGFAVGLGNIWRFPYVTGENGGSAFVIVYLVFAFGIGVPILMAEIMLGRRGGMTPPNSMGEVAALCDRSRSWSGVGYLNLVTAFSILIGYGVVAGWVLFYLLQAISGGFSNISPKQSTLNFNNMLGDITTLIFWTVVALGLACAIIYAGVQKGIERAVTVLMPLLFVLLIGLAVFNVFAGGMGQALSYLFEPDFSKLSADMLLAAIGQAFFSIGVAMAGMMMFGAYLPKEVSIGRSAFIIVTADTLVALLAGLVIFPMVFNNNLDPSGGAGLIFQTLPVAFAHMPGGMVVGILFFLLLSVAAVTSVVGLCEPVAAWLCERFQWTRPRAAVTLWVVLVICSLLSVLSYNVWSDVSLFGLSLNAALDYFPNQIFLPLGGLMIALFAGWRLNRAMASEELGLGDSVGFTVWYNAIRYLVVPAVALILITGVAG
ncbi:MAG: sodium-dependent transporter [Pseudomonadota bacterium]